MMDRHRDGTAVRMVGPYGHQYTGTVVGWDGRTGQYKIRHDGTVGHDLWEPHQVAPIEMELEPIAPTRQEPQRETINFCKRDPWSRNHNR